MFILIPQKRGAGHHKKVSLAVVVSVFSLMSDVIECKTEVKSKTNKRNLISSGDIYSGNAQFHRIIISTVIVNVVTLPKCTSIANQLK